MNYRSFGLFNVKIKFVKLHEMRNGIHGKWPNRPHAVGPVKLTDEII